MVNKDLGMVTAYAYAVSKGYTGTEEEFAALMADYAAVGQRAEQAATAAAASATAASGSASDSAASATAAEGSATAAATSAGNASQAAQSASQSATAAAGSATAAGQSATAAADSATTAGNKATEAAQSATEAAASAITAGTAATNAQTAQTAAEAAQTAAEDAQGAAEDAAESVEGKTEQIDQNTEDISLLKSQLDGLYGATFNGIIAWVNGEYIDRTDGTVKTNATYKRTDYIAIDPNYYNLGIKSVDPLSHDPFYNAWYDEDKNFISNFSYVRNDEIVLTPPANARYFRMSCGKCVEITIFPGFKKSVVETSNELEEYKESIGFIKPEITGWIDGKYVSRADGTEQSNTTYHATDFIAINPKLGDIVLTSTNAGNYDTNYNVWYDEDKNFISNFSYARDGEKTFTPPSSARYFRLSCNKNVVLSISTSYDDKTLVDFLPIQNNGNLLISSALHKTNLNVLPVSGGLLTYSQSFCIYNGKYYSTNGSYISEQNATFTELRNSAVSVGHGNSMQLGILHPNYAYISGWNDQNVYVVDLDTLTLVDTIVLPTTGYTTAAIDDVNSIAYIFQRGTYPSTEEQYNFIAYDYANSAELYRRKTPKFAAMQACDFYNGSIIVLNGLGSSAAPNYCKVYSTSGDVVAQYIIPAFLGTGEPEGVCFNRSDFTLYMSKENRTVYKIT